MNNYDYFFQVISAFRSPCFFVPITTTAGGFLNGETVLGVVLLRHQKEAHIDGRKGDGMTVDDFYKCGRMRASIKVRARM